jgi:hypothetical protein
MIRRQSLQNSLPECVAGELHDHSKTVIAAIENRLIEPD